MDKKLQIRFTWLYAIIVLLDLVSSSFSQLYFFRFFTKPAILLSLIVFVFVVRKQIKASIALLLLALCFSLLGDILLLFANRSELYFMLGLVAFLVAHVVYVLIFLKKRNTEIKTIGFLLITFIYGGFLFYTLQNNLGSMKIPVLLYMLVILGMANAAYLRRGKVINQSYRLVFIGALLFMVSDSVLAVDKFHHSIWLSNVWIMITYAIAQILLTFGVLQE